MIGTELGPYRVLERVGAGGMGEVYRARDTRLGREVAIKVLPAAMLGDATVQQRFEREAKAASALNHPGIVTPRHRLSSRYALHRHGVRRREHN